MAQDSDLQNRPDEDSADREDGGGRASMSSGADDVEQVGDREDRESDPPAVEEAASQPEVGKTTPPLPRDRSRVMALGAMGALVAVGIGLIVVTPKRGSTPPSLALTSADLNAPASSASGSAVEAKEAPAAAVSAPVIVTPRPPPAWRVTSLKLDAAIEVSEGTFGKNGFVQTLTNAGISRPEIKRIARAFDGVKRVDRPAATDSFVVAKKKNGGAVVAFEYATSPMDVWQARVDESDAPAAEKDKAKDDDSRIIGRKLDLFIEHKKVGAGLVVAGDLAKAIATAGLRQEIVDAVDDALEGHIEPGSIRAGTRMRIVGTEDWVEGTFARMKVDAIEFVPKSGQPLRIYYYERDATVEGSARRAPAAGFYDTKGKQPYHGQFRTPLALARVTSRFNPKRLHPVLKVVMPHNGVDYAASTGTPIYASAAGTVTTAGNGGPCGNMVEIEHGGGIATVYCHMKGFATGLRAGQKVESRQLLGYAGQTGRVTGPHLHFGVKKNGNFIDPLALKMDGVRVLPQADRDAFSRKRSDLDAQIDGVALPSAADIPEENEDKDLHGE